ncbi:TerC family protein [Paenibacillus sp. NPDC058071]|uniref:TerC family protein n=1 Tax=Paenibacillus sp. NPDC058071 TaxID=3346326 RepID=UPI0036DBFB0B
MESLMILLQIVMINLLLSGDNAVVIAMASQSLPKQQQRKAVWWGAMAAVGLRCLLTLAAISLLQTPYLQAVGSLLLLYIAVKLLIDADNGGEVHAIKKANTLGQAVRTIVVADLVMSLDNVLAIAAVAKGETLLIVLGIALSIPMIIWGSRLLGTLLVKFPSFVYIGSGLLGYAAGGMLVHDPGLTGHFANAPAVIVQSLPLFCAPLVIAFGIMIRRMKAQ